MNHRRALRASTNFGLSVFVVMICGVVLWTTDEVLEWNLLPDWIDQYAELLVMILSILAGFSVVISVMCSLAVMAESAAERAGITAPRPSHRARLLIVLGVFAAFGVMFGLHKVDEFRAARLAAIEEQEERERYDAVQAALREAIPETAKLFSMGVAEQLASPRDHRHDASTARLLRAIEVSTEHDPGVAVLVAADPPYTHCIIRLQTDRERKEGVYESGHLAREYLTGFPQDWEREAVSAALAGEPPELPSGRRGVFIDTRAPSAWGPLRNEIGQVVGIVMLRGRT